MRLSPDHEINAGLPIARCGSAPAETFLAQAMPGVYAGGHAFSGY